MTLQNRLQTACSPLKGNMRQPPRVAWSYWLGLSRPPALIDQTRSAPVLLDLNDDGKSETIECAYGAMSFLVRNGADGAELWSATVEQPIYEQLFSVADVNADGRLDLCLVTHYRAEVFDASTGKQLLKIPWDVGRNYGFNTWVNVDGDPQLECIILSDYTTHVDLLDVDPNGSASLGWSTIYRRDVDENAPLDLVRGRRDLRYIYDSVQDLDGDGRYELLYMVFNQADRREWRTIVRELPTGKSLAEAENLFVYGIDDIDQDGACEIFAGETRSYGTRGFTQLGVWQFTNGALTKQLDLGRGRFSLMFDALPPHASAGGQKTTEQSTVAGGDFDGDGARDVLIERDATGDGAPDAYEIVRIQGDRVETTVRFHDEAQTLAPELIHRQADGRLSLSGFDLSNADTIDFLLDGTIERRANERSAWFTSDPVAADLDGDGTREIAVQSPDGFIHVLAAADLSAPPRLLWKCRGWGMNPHPGYNLPARGVAITDLERDGRAELLVAGIDRNGWASMRAVTHDGQVKWEHPFESVAADWPDSGANQWSVGRFNNDRISDVIVQYHDLGHSSAKLRALDGRNGRMLWEIVQADLHGLPRHLASPNIVVADLNTDSIDDIGLMPANGFAAFSGADGSPLAAERFYPPDQTHPNKWKPKDCDAPYYAKISARDIDRDGTAEIFFSDRLTQAALRVWPRVEKLWVIGEAHPGEIAGQFRAEDNPLLADFDGGGDLEFCAFHRDGKMTLLDASTGQVKAELTIPATPTTEAVAADIDGDGATDILFGAGNRIYAITVRRTTPVSSEVLWVHEFPAPVGAPAVADLDDDGHAELLVPTADAHLHCLMASSSHVQD